jgi:uncharacterized protein with HEPN domain
VSKDWRLQAHHILEAATWIERYAASLDFGCLNEETMARYDGILRRLQTLAEATQYLPEALKQRYPHVDWRRARGFRNVLVHDYLGDIQPGTIEVIVREHLPPLKAAVAAMLAGKGDVL